MPTKAATITAAPSFSGGGATILCSQRSSLFNRLQFPSPNSRICFNYVEPLFARPYRKSHVFVIPRAADSKGVDSTSQSSRALIILVMGSKTDFGYDECPWVSFGVIGLSLGVTLLSYGFGAYFNILPGSEWSALMLTYGFPLAIIGMALKYAELKPVPCLTYSDAHILREKCATPILKQVLMVRNDVTRYRYGDEQHLDEALQRIFQYGQGGGIPRRSAPVLQMIREEIMETKDWPNKKSLNFFMRSSSRILDANFYWEKVTEDGRYCLVLVFKAKDLQLSDFEKRQGKFTSFFGPGITAEIGKGEEDRYEIRLISNTISE
ncbi:hypothetical protein RHMOL_Rhmol08G0091300 [Rhododendron molle]|uniref:Uncharacterized protein n=1 Tax=Rhododendron molle TaxID=49168 RepID=A0ACC0MNE4_RHOML|nr:hypothetical protein RHMOL_Rhmol08G0091300 [Rhododendron molle]